MSVPKMLIGLLVSLLAPVAVRGEKEEPVLSPDKKWAYRLVENQAVLIRAETGEAVLKLVEDENSLLAETGEVLWAPDSRRVAFNYRAGGRYYACAVFELAGDKWKALPDLESKATKVANMIKRAEQRDRKRLGVGKSADRRRINDRWSVRRWIDADTFEAFASSEASVVVNKKTEDVDYIGGAVLFTVKCDNKGGWKITRLRELSVAEEEKLINAEAED